MCERVLEDPSISREKAQLRAVALQILGEAFMSVKKEDANAPGNIRGFGEDADYVKVDTKSSKARDTQQASPQQQPPNQYPNFAKR